MRGQTQAGKHGWRAMTNAEFLERLQETRPDLTALEEYNGWRNRIYFECKMCGYIWPAKPDVVLRSKKCPDCSGRHQRTHDEFVEELARKNPNITPLGKFTKTKDTILCRCNKCGHEWSPFAYNLLQGSGCPECEKASRPMRRHLGAVQKGNLLEVRPDIALEWDYEGNEGHRPEEFSYGCNYEADWICPVGHHYKALISSRTASRGSSGCTVCNFRSHTSFPEQAIYYYVRQHFSDTINSYKEGFGHSELDVYIPSLKTGVEYDGPWHKDNFDGDCRKYELCRSLGIRLIRIRESKEPDLEGVLCDVLLYSDYPNSKFVGLDHCLISLFSYLEINADIDTQRDCLAIKAQYYTILKENSLAVKYPEIASEWDYEKNGTLTPDMFSSGADDVVYWKCPRGHHYRAQILSRTHGSGCQRCAGLKKKTTEEFRGEMSVVNPSIEVLGEYTGNKDGILCRCKICEHEWSPTPNCVLRGSGCPNCANMKRSQYKMTYHKSKREQKK